MRYAIVIEKADGNYSAYVPDLPGCVATGATVNRPPATRNENLGGETGVVGCLAVRVLQRKPRR